jgi:hypothetical protein
MSNTTRPICETVSFEQYKCSADRLRAGCALDGDLAVCDQWDTQQKAAGGVRYKSIYDLPIAERILRDAMSRQREIEDNSGVK